MQAAARSVTRRATKLNPPPTARPNTGLTLHAMQAAPPFCQSAVRRGWRSGTRSLGRAWQRLACTHAPHLARHLFPLPAIRTTQSSRTLRQTWFRSPVMDRQELEPGHSTTGQLLRLLYAGKGSGWAAPLLQPSVTDLSSSRWLW